MQVTTFTFENPFTIVSSHQTRTNKTSHASCITSTSSSFNPASHRQTQTRTISNTNCQKRIQSSWIQLQYELYNQCSNNPINVIQPNMTNPINMQPQINSYIGCFQPATAKSFQRPTKLSQSQLRLYSTSVSIQIQPDHPSQTPSSRQAQCMLFGLSS